MGEVIFAYGNFKPVTYSHEPLINGSLCSVSELENDEEIPHATIATYDTTEAFRRYMKIAHPELEICYSSDVGNEHMITTSTKRKFFLNETTVKDLQQNITLLGGK